MRGRGGGGGAQVSIVPRGAAALGFAQYLPNENMLMTTEQMQDMTCMALGGRAAEEVMIGKISTGESWGPPSPPHACLPCPDAVGLTPGVHLAVGWWTHRCCAAITSAGLCLRNLDRSQSARWAADLAGRSQVECQAPASEWPRRGWVVGGDGMRGRAVQAPRMTWSG